VGRPTGQPLHCRSTPMSHHRCRLRHCHPAALLAAAHARGGLEPLPDSSSCIRTKPLLRSPFFWPPASSHTAPVFYTRWRWPAPASLHFSSKLLCRHRSWPSPIASRAGPRLHKSPERPHATSTAAAKCAAVTGRFWWSPHPMCFKMGQPCRPLACGVSGSPPHCQQLPAGRAVATVRRAARAQAGVLGKEHPSCWAGQAAHAH
jgi:hypothetical protein